MTTKPPDGPPCILHKVHHPSVAMNLAYNVGEETVALCPTGAVNVDVCVAYMQGQGRAPGASLGRETWDLAQRRVDFLQRQANTLT